MFNKSILTFVVFSIIIINCLKADEGMWLPQLIQQLNIKKMHSMGCKLSAEDIYSINKASLKDAIVSIDQGSCTGELISGDGLILTNHHCGYDEIQNHSSVEHDYLTDGFWASGLKEELPNPGKTVSFLIRIEDVTVKIISKLNPNLSELARNAKIRDVSGDIEREAVGETDYDASVVQMFDGNSFYLCVYETFRDVRLVGAPPESIGKFGGDTDNWMWPRHTGDFSIFRVYCSPNGKPAEYAENNVPYHPKYYFPISLKGYEKGDFAMVLGYPGTTNRYTTSWGVEEIMNIQNNIRYKVRTIKQDIWKADMDSDPKVRIQYASKYSRSSNYWKYSLGQNNGLVSLDVVGKKKELEKRLVNWINADKITKEKYSLVLPLIEKAYNDEMVYDKVLNYWLEAFWSGAEFVKFALYADQLNNVLIQGSPESIKDVIEAYKNKAKDFFKDYNSSTDKKVVSALFKLYNDEIDKEYYPSIFHEIDKKNKGNFEKFANELFKKSIFTDEKRFNTFIEKPQLKTLIEDIGYRTVTSLFELYRTVGEKKQEIDYDLLKGSRLLAQALKEMDSTTVFYPDANSTLRMTYGQIGDYEPHDAVIYKHYTTIHGYVEKEDPKNKEFTVPVKLKELINSKYFGRYAKNGELNTCFTTNNDITGGNSGSPVINANGELIGVAFDGNWEAMSGDIAFEPNIQKCICVDIRFVLFIIDKFANDSNLIKEMKIIE